MLDKGEYLNQKDKALFLGIFTSNLAYCTILENGQKSVDYSDMASYLSSELMIEDAYGQEFVKRLENNIDNFDSLVIITNEAYYETCNFFELNGLNNVLPFVVYRITSYNVCYTKLLRI